VCPPQAVLRAQEIARLPELSEVGRSAPAWALCRASGDGCAGTRPPPRPDSCRDHVPSTEGSPAPGRDSPRALRRGRAWNPVRGGSVARTLSIAPVGDQTTSAMRRSVQCPSATDPRPLAAGRGREARHDLPGSAAVVRFRRLIDSFGLDLLRKHGPSPALSDIGGPRDRGSDRAVMRAWGRDPALDLGRNPVTAASPIREARGPRTQTSI
jgi:hypothetical protein